MANPGRSDALKAALGRTAECPSIEELDRVLGLAPADAERQSAERHLASCAFCQAELSLLRSFEDAQPAQGEEIPVKWITSRLTTPRSAPVRRSISAWGRGFAAAACLFLVAGGVLYVAQRRDEPGLTGPGIETMRSGAVQIVAPMGDLAAVPGELRWQPVSGAAGYDVRLLEADRHEIWRTQISGAGVSLPDSVRAQIIPRKTLFWEVSARNSSGAVIADSGMQTFRVAPR